AGRPAAGPLALVTLRVRSAVRRWPRAGGARVVVARVGWREHQPYGRQGRPVPLGGPLERGRPAGTPQFRLAVLIPRAPSPPYKTSVTERG
ncbi:MAG TPA: hypothetical protein VHW06_00635, partial [Streptosporangiaceae bacterium]|nr:hypothetical protein [Streptosporangiaceae bacterium]